MDITHEQFDLGVNPQINNYNNKNNNSNYNKSIAKMNEKARSRPKKTRKINKEEIRALLFLDLRSENPKSVQDIPLLKTTRQ